jgi:hypothetical protein
MRPKTCDIGSGTSTSRVPALSTTDCRADDTDHRLSAVSMTPLARPVVPPV